MDTRNQQNSKGRLRPKKRRKKSRKSAFYRKLRLTVFYSTVLLAVVGTGIILSLTVLFKIDRIEVVGDTRYDKEAIVAASGIHTGENLFLAHPEPGIAVIAHDMPYIDTVTIDRKIPSKMVIEVSEAVPAGLVEYEGKYVVVSDTTKILEICDQPIEGVPIIKGIEVENIELADTLFFKNDGVKQVLHSVSEETRKNGLKEINEIDLTDLSNITLWYQNRIKIVLGNAEDLDYKFQTAVAILTTRLGPQERGTLNLSVVSRDSHSYFMPEYMTSGMNDSLS